MKRQPGRPRVDRSDTSTRVTVTLPTRLYDEYASLALRDCASVPALIRRDLIRKKKPGARQ